MVLVKPDGENDRLGLIHQLQNGKGICFHGRQHLMRQNISLFVNHRGYTPSYQQGNL